MILRHPFRNALQTLLLGLLPLSAASAATTMASAPTLIPAPALQQTRDGAFAFGPATTLRGHDADSRATAEFFDTLLRRSHGFALRESARNGHAIDFAIDRNTPVANDAGYVLDVSPKGVAVRARSAEGLQNGAATLWQLTVDAHGPRRTIPAVHIEDAPRFGWRGLLIDSARHFRTVDEIKHIVDAMAIHKLNVLHWHLTDDQGWRIEIKRYPKLATVGGCRQPSGDAGVGADGKPVRECGWYTQAQIRDVVRYARDRHIEIVPEIDIPGHATAMIAAYPQLGVIDAPLAPVPQWGVFTNLLRPDETTLGFLDNVYAEVADLFPGRYIHIGGDEATKDQWIASPTVQAKKHALGLQTEMQLQLWMVAHIEKTLAAHGKRLIGWDEILEGDLPPSATIMSWRGTEGGLQAAKAGHDAVMTPASHVYLDYQQSHSPDEASGRPTLVTMRKLYDYEPMPDGLTEAQQQHILGVQANVWTEHMRTFAMVEHAIFPRLAALAEIGWSPRAARDYRGFVARLPAMLQRYRLLGIDAARTPLQVVVDAQPSDDATRANVTMDNALDVADIRYTTDGSAPDARSKRYEGPFDVALPTTLRAAAFVDGIALTTPDTRVVSLDTLRVRTDDAMTTCHGALPLRLEDDTTANGKRAVFLVDIFKPCWSWKRAPLSGIKAMEVRAGRIPYFFQLAHDESGRTFLPAQTVHGEVIVKATCDGPIVATAPLPATTDANGFVTLRLPMTTPLANTDLCIQFTGDTRPQMWVLDRIRLLPQ